MQACPHCKEDKKLRYNYLNNNPNMKLQSIQCGQCGATFLDKEDLRLLPYDRLKSILTDEILTEKASANLDELLGIKSIKKNNLFTKIADIFKKIDSVIFKKPSKISNNPHKRLK